MSDDSKHLSDLRALAEARKRATPGKQWIDGTSSDDAVIRGELPTFFFARVVMRHPENEAMADLYIRAANHDFPGLIAHLEKLERVAEKAKNASTACQAAWEAKGADNAIDGWYQAQSELDAALAALETDHE